jgi:L-lactate utilization protein LutB
MIGGDRYANVVQIVNRLVAGHYLYRDEDEEIRKELMAGVDGLDETHRQWEAEIALEDHEEERKEIKEDALAELEAILAKMEKNIAGVRPLLRD